MAEPQQPPIISPQVQAVAALGGLIVMVALSGVAMYVSQSEEKRARARAQAEYRRIYGG